MVRTAAALVATIALASAATAATADPACDPCDSTQPTIFEAQQRPLHIEIESGLRFGRMALRGHGDGAARLDPETGLNRVEANMINLGGASFEGRVRVTGEPLRPVRIELPSTVLLRSSDGGEARLSDFVTDLPPVAMLDRNGVLEFGFGARLTSQGSRGGDFRGRIRIRVDYF